MLSSVLGIAWACWTRLHLIDERMMDSRQDLLDSIEAALGVMGTVKESIYWYLRNHSIHRDEIPEKLEQFRKVLHELLGYGAKIVEKLAVKAYAERTGIPPAMAEGKDLGEIVEIANYQARKSPSFKEANGSPTEGDIV